MFVRMIFWVGETCTNRPVTPGTSTLVAVQLVEFSALWWFGAELRSCHTLFVYRRRVKRSVRPRPSSSLSLSPCDPSQ